MLDIISALFNDLDTGKGHMPPSILYNEGWLLRVILYWFSKNLTIEHPLAFQPGADWYSEGLLSSQFFPQYRGDELAETYTHADGIIGNIGVGKEGKADVFLVEPFKQFAVLEAKLCSKLSGDTTRIPGYNQVARTVACMASVISNSRCPVEEFDLLGFYVLAPENEIEKEPTFYAYMGKESVYDTVLSRVELYKDRSNYLEKRKWFEEYFEPLLMKIELLLISWEEVIFDIKQYDSEMEQELGKFYVRCLAFNKSL